MTWIQKELVPRAKGTYVLGPEKYAKKLHYDEMVDVPLDDLLRVGQEELDRLEARYAELLLPETPVALGQVNQLVKK